MENQAVAGLVHTYIALQTLFTVRLRREAAVCMGTLGAPRLAGHARHGDGRWASIRLSVSNLTV